MLLTGNRGNGKSTITRALAGDLEAEGWFVIWAKAKALTDRMWNASDRVKLVSALDVADVLFIDEAVFEDENRHTVGTLFAAVDARFEAGKSTIMTSNFDGKALAEHYQAALCRGLEGEDPVRAKEMVGRFMSRLQPPRYQRVAFTGPDFRVANRQNWAVLPGGAA
jgi:DNA replication protein DnaC